MLDIGAEVEKKRNAVVERERQKAIRSTEEVVRREEESKRLEVSYNCYLLYQTTCKLVMDNIESSNSVM